MSASVEFTRVSATEDAVVIRTETPCCYKCGARLYGGEVETRECDGCRDCEVAE